MDLDFIVDTAVRDLTVNNLVRFGDEILLREAETNLQYSVVGYSNKIQGAFSDVTSTPQLHSPIIGWAYDGNPIYALMDIQKQIIVIHYLELLHLDMI